MSHYRKVPFACNMNDVMLVKLTPEGEEVFRKHNRAEANQIRQFMAGKMNDYLERTCKEIEETPLPEVDSNDGRRSFQIFHFMQIFGPYMRMGFNTTFVQHNSVVFLREELTEHCLPEATKREDKYR